MYAIILAIEWKGEILKMKNLKEAIKQMSKKKKILCLSIVIIVLVIIIVAVVINKDTDNLTSSYYTSSTIKSSLSSPTKVKVINYDKSGTDLEVTLQNNNETSYKITEYSKVRITFDDGSYDTAYLSSNITLEPQEKYTFEDCYIGYSNKSKYIKSVTLIP